MTDKFDDTDAVWSALLDGQENGQAARFLLNRVERDEVLRQRWSRWALAGDLLARRAVLPAPSDFADRVAAAIRAEGTPQRSVNGRPAWWGWAGGLAVAASVAWVAVTLVSVPGAERVSPVSSVADAPLAAPPSRAPVVGPAVVNTRGVQQVSVSTLAQPVNFVPFQGEDAYWIRHGLGAQVAPLGSLGTLAWLPRSVEPVSDEPTPLAAPAETR
ncbi:MAG: sigma-E factor negative regulatory protein [Xanthomonadales bacterium]|nr:sigma-E factor negative regulatory protein [Xanthomonadales bacterium]